MTIYDILKDSSYKTEQFSTEAIERLNANIVEKEGKNIQSIMYELVKIFEKQNRR